MEVEFDKEIDSLLRQAARGETFVSEDFKAHADADEISLFAENALSPKARARITTHLADCAQCRKTLSNVIALNAEAEAGAVIHPAPAPKMIAAAAPIPWYRKLFAFPQLAYTMGGLAILLAAMLGFVALQSVQRPPDASIAQMEKQTERPRNAGGADSDGETVTTETYSANSNAPLTQSDTIANAASVAGSSNQTSTAANANIPAPIQNKKQDSAGAGAAAPSVPRSQPASEEKAQEAESRETISADGFVVSQAPAPAQSNYSAARNQTQITPDSNNVQSRQVQDLPGNGRSAAQLEMRSTARAAEDDRSAADAAKPRAKSAKNESAENPKIVGGKRFVRRSGAWYDASYNQQKTVNVRRNSDEYQKLDAGLRSIADNLGGTIVVVWKNAAYRIQ